MDEQFKKILQRAVRDQVSDIYFKLNITEMALTFLLPSGVSQVDHIDRNIGAALIRFIKFQAHLNLTETRRPQAGHWVYRFKTQDLQLRVSTVGDFKQAESVVIRIIYPIESIHNVLKHQPSYCELGESIQTQSGLFVIGGAMGSGKSTTLACLLHEYLKQSIVLSIEDPVEIEQAHILQLQVNVLAQMTYLNLFKLALRHHPQFIVIGEIRDTQTARLVVEAALSGHCILTTLHALSLNDIRQRLLNLGVNPHDLASALTGIAFQRRTDQQMNFSFKLTR